MLDLGFVLLLTLVAAGIGLRLLDQLGGRPRHRPTPSHWPSPSGSACWPWVYSAWASSAS